MTLTTNAPSSVSIATYNNLGLEALLQTLSLSSTLGELKLFNFSLEIDNQAIAASEMFKRHPLLPGVLLTKAGKIVGMISRQRFWQQMSHPYGISLFSKRPIRELYQLSQVEHLILPEKTSIVQAAQQSLQRSSELLNEPIIVQLEPRDYRLLDIHQLLVAQSHIHALTTELLEKQTQAKLMQMEKMALLGQMVASVAHEILNPVNFISGNLHYLERYGNDLLQIIHTYNQALSPQPEAVVSLKEDVDFDFIARDFPQLVSSVKMGADRLKKIISTLRNFSHVDDSEYRPIDIHECLEDTLVILHGRLKHQITISKSYSDLPAIKAHPIQLSQVFMNLISNAIDALMEQLSLATDRSWQPQIQIQTSMASDPDWLSIQIADNGPGIPLEIQERIFEVFFTTKPVGEGTGLGLAISHQIIVEKHGGQLNLWSQPGVGTRFEVLLPLA